MERIIVRKTVGASGDYFIFFKEGQIQYPLFVLDSSGAGYLLKEMINASDSGFQLTDDGKVVKS